jgi:hypothetical protein
MGRTPQGTDPATDLLNLRRDRNRSATPVRGGALYRAAGAAGRRSRQGEPVEGGAVQAGVVAVETRKVPTADAAAVATPYLHEPRRGVSQGTIRLVGLAIGVAFVAAREGQLVADVPSMPRTSPSASDHTSMPA